MRKKLLLGNWKMNKTVSEAKDFASQTAELVKFANEHDVLVGVAPTYLCLQTVKDNTEGVIVAAQNCHFEDSGAYTGEVSIPMLKDLGVNWVIIGHSERRTYDNETDAKCNKKIVKLVQNDMVPVYCCGETLAQFEAGETKSVVETQIRDGLANLCSKCISKVVVAYEPVWSIGTGKNASKEIAQDVCAYIRKEIAKLYGRRIANKVIIQYGGSVKPVNVREYLTQPDIDGALVGGASLKAETFIELISNLY